MLRPQPCWRVLARLTQLSWRVERRGFLMTGSRQLSAHDTCSQTLLVAKYSSAVQPRKGVLEVKTLRPDRLVFTSQSVLKLPERYTCYVAFTNGDPFKLKYTSRGITKEAYTPYPPDTEGVFYYNSAESELRFRLCKEIEGFEHGQDLVHPNGKVWCRSLDRMANFPRIYAAPLSLITAEFDITSKDIAPIRNSHRVVSTFSPGQFSLVGQQVVDISGKAKADFSVHLSSKKPAKIIYVTQRERNEGKLHRVPFQPNTIGMFYYRQPQTCPTRLGELRFRLCSDVNAFDEGTDLCLPSGDPWFISSSSLHLNSSTQSFRDLLVQEGLLEHDLYPVVPNLIHDQRNTHLTSLEQPFIVDFSQWECTIDLITLSPQESSIRIRYRFLLRDPVAYVSSFSSGRAIVRLEQFPSSLSPTRGSKPTFAMRVLEEITPVKRSTHTGRVLDPVPGELLLVRRIKDNLVVPWSYTARKPDIRNAIEKWIAWQSSSSKLES